MQNQIWQIFINLLKLLKKVNDLIYFVEDDYIT
jgi:hypothetical protein